MKRSLVTLLLLTAVGAAADPLDASVPDASVGMGGADMTSEENDTTGLPCLDSRECDSRTSCVDGRCIPLKPRNAAGCGGGALASLGALAGFGLVLSRRRRQG
ncbi:MAG: hypothetical protein JNG84_00110 [Archangium sp.]|nr:hypothetical protein [Archangium sp.]